jgi:hypothetical protein
VAAQPGLADAAHCHPEQFRNFLKHFPFSFFFLLFLLFISAK